MRSVFPSLVFGILVPAPVSKLGSMLLFPDSCLSKEDAQSVPDSLSVELVIPDVSGIPDS